MASKIENILSDKDSILNWIKKYNLSMNCYPEVVLRLFVILAVLYVNFGGYFGLFFEILGRREITSLLPWKFYQTMKKLIEAERKEMEIEVVAEALKEIGNPLVIVNMERKLSIRHAIHLNLNDEQYKKHLMVLGIEKSSSIWREAIKQKITFFKDR